MFLAVVFVFELIAVAVAVAAWMINQTLDEHDYSSENDGIIFKSFSPISSTTAGVDPCQSTENQKKPVAFESFGGSSSDGKEAILTPRSVLDDQFLYLNESQEHDRVTRKAKHSLRNNFEWDSAFFTSDGMLDPVELSCLINGHEQGNMRILPGIEDGVWKSTDSIFTLGSDNLILEDLESDLFEDIRASMEKSSEAFPATTSDTCKPTSCESQAISSKRKPNLSSRNQMQQPAFKKPTGTSKSLTNQTLRTQGTVRALKQDVIYSQVQQSVVRRGDPYLTLPQGPRVIKSGKSTPTITAKKPVFASNEANKMKHYKATINTAADRGPRALKKPVVSCAYRVLTKPASFCQSCSFDSSISIQSTAYSLTDNSGSVCSDKICKSHFASIRRKVGDPNVDSPSRASTFKPTKNLTRNSTSSVNSAVSAYLMSTSSRSPYSSISEWSSSSPSSSTSLDTSSCRSSGYGCINSAVDDHYNSQSLENHNFSSVNGALNLSSTIASLQHHQIKENQGKPDLLKSLGGSISNVKEAALVPSGDQDDQLPCLNKSLEPARTTRKTKNHLRKSLDWDSAFFTSAGVLDTEELSCLINGAELSEKQTLLEYETITSDLNDHISSLSLSNHENEGMATPNGSVRKSSSQADTFSRWASASPSALRMPSPKFWFFDWFVLLLLQFFILIFLISFCLVCVVANQDF